MWKFPFLTLNFYVIHRIFRCKMSNRRAQLHYVVNCFRLRSKQRNKPNKNFIIPFLPFCVYYYIQSTLSNCHLSNCRPSLIVASCSGPDDFPFKLPSLIVAKPSIIVALPSAAPEKIFQKNLGNTSPKFEKFCQIFYIFRRILSKI